MNYSHEVENMCTVTKGPHHGPAPIPEEGKWVKAYEIKDISGLSHGIGWCAPQQGACTKIPICINYNRKRGDIQEFRQNFPLYFVPRPFPAPKESAAGSHGPLGRPSGHP